MTEMPKVSEADISNRIMITTRYHTDCVAVDREDIPQLIEELQKYE